MIRLASTLGLLTMLACQAPSEPPRKSGFLSSYTQLEEAGPTSLRWADEAALARYTSFLIDPVETYFHDEARESGREANWDNLNAMRAYTHAAVRSAIEDSYTLVARPGPGVARVRIALTDINETRPFLKLVTLGRDAGGVSMEAEIIDSRTGEQLAAVVEVQKGSPVEMERFGPLDDCKDIVDAWARRFRERLDEIYATR